MADSFVLIRNFPASPVSLLEKHNRTALTADFDYRFADFHFVVGLVTRDFRPPQIRRNCAKASGLSGSRQYQHKCGGVQAIGAVVASLAETAATQSATLLQILRWGRYIFRYSRPIPGFLLGVNLLVSY